MFNSLVIAVDMEICLEIEVWTPYYINVNSACVFS